MVAACSFTAPGNSVPTTDAPRSDAAAVDASTGIHDGNPDAAGGCVDLNGDGICDSQTWTCGTQPTPPSNPLSLGGLSNVAGANLGGDGAFLVAVAGATIPLRYAYGIDIMCPGSSGTCPAQIEFGLVSGGRLGCLFDGTVQTNRFQGQLGQQTTLAVPTTPGVYDVRANIGLNPSCGTGSGWYGSEPPATATFAYICVP